MTTLDLFADTTPPKLAPATREPARAHRATNPDHWFTIPPHRPFLRDVAVGLHRTLAHLGPEGLAEAVVLTPTRRTARALAEAFVDAARGEATLLPQIRTLGDLDAGEPPFEPGDVGLDLAPAVTPLRRRCELARIVVANQHVLKRELDAAAALKLADALAAFLDATQIEEATATPGALAALAPEELAEHWQVSSEFLQLALVQWPERLAYLGLMDVKARETAVVRALAERFWTRPPETVLVAAGVQGDAPASADLLSAVAAAPKGAVILPGLDLDLADDAWGGVDDAHPQAAMKGLLERAGLTRAEVQPWPLFDESAADAARGRSRRRVISEALRPPEKTHEWLGAIADLRAEGAQAGVDPIAEGLQGLAVLAAANEEAAAAQAALLLREALEVPGRTAALVTPDPALARRVSARLARWGIVVDSSAGLPLDRTPVGALIGLTAGLAAEPTDPAALLAVAKHPLVRLGRSPLELDGARRDFERRALRGPRGRGWAELIARLEGDPDPIKQRPQIPAAQALVRALQAAVEHARAPFREGAADPIAAVRALAEAMELLAADEKGAPGDLWAGADGEQAAGLFAGLMQDAQGLPALTLAAFAELMAELARGEVVRQGARSHPRLRILGLIEARLNRADVTVLAGLEEGAWPAAAPTDPLLSRGMRKTLGLPSPERRIGTAAHDFAQAACGPSVTLIASARRDGAPATRSRWLWRLQMLAAGANVELPSRAEIAAWAEALEAPDPHPPIALRLAERPKPTPPVAVRPRELAATRVEEWIRDPYATYARYILNLKAMDPPDAPLEARARGVAIHAAFERFSLEHPDAPWGSAEVFEAMLLEALGSAGLPEAGHARERPLAKRLGGWAAELEQARRPGAQLLIEKKGTLTFTTADGEFTLTAKADRLEVRADRIDVIDFKSGGSASKKEVKVGLAPQLTLTAAIAEAGGFEGAPALPPGELIYAKVTGRRNTGELEKRVEGEEAFHAARALERLKARVEAFEAESTPYLAKQQPKFISADGKGDYDHLMRLWEWRVVGEGDDAETGAGGE